jgi:hypothetical protein
MNHLRQYISLITKAKARGTGSEAHHIFPVSIFGKNDKVVLLTMREHWIAHKLLFHICLKRYGKHPYTYKMSNAVRMMGNRTSRQYKTAREYFIENHHTKTEEGRKALSERQKGEKSHMWGKPAPNRGIPHRPESNEKNRQSQNKTYEVTFSNGDKIIVVGMKKFAMDNGYNHSHLIQIGKGNRKRHKNVIGVLKID